MIEANQQREILVISEISCESIRTSHVAIASDSPFTSAQLADLPLRRDYLIHSCTEILVIEDDTRFERESLPRITMTVAP